MQVGYAQTTAFGSVVLIASTVYTDFSGWSWTSQFDRKVGLFFGVARCFSMPGCPNMQLFRGLLPRPQKNCFLGSPDLPESTKRRIVCAKDIEDAWTQAVG